MKIFDLSLRLNRFPITRARQRLTEITLVTEADYQSFIENRKREIVAYHQKNNAFYREIAGENPLAWKDVPVMTKADFQRPLAERLSKGFTGKNVFINKTSGSGGHPFTFAKDKFCHALIWANIMRRFSWFGIDLNHSFQARFYGMPVDYLGNAKLRLKDVMARRFRFSIFDLSDNGLAKITDGFAKKTFDHINGYTSSIVQLAKFLQRKNIVLKDICPTLKVCITTSEMLFDDDRKLLQNQFGVPVVNEYGASELEVIAFENPAGEWLLNTETLFVEILDAENNCVPNGVEGKIVVTALDNLAHPMIRYEVGDFGVIDEKSTAKKAILKKLIGRTNDIAVLPSGKKPAGMTFYSITKKLFDDTGNVKEFVIRQTKLDTFEIEYTAQNALSEPEMDKMRKTMTDFLEPGLQFIFLKRDSLNRSPSGKLKQFTSLINDK